MAKIPNPRNAETVSSVRLCMGLFKKPGPTSSKIRHTSETLRFLSRILHEAGYPPGADTPRRSRYLPSGQIRARPYFFPSTSASSNTDARQASSSSLAESPSRRSKAERSPPRAAAASRHIP